VASPFTFGLPPSIGKEGATHRAARLERFLSEALQRPALVRVATNYQALKGELIAGTMLAAWGPPFVCARVEAYGGRGLLRGVRHGNATYRSALVTLASRKLVLGVTTGLRCAWVDPDSVGGFVLPTAWLKEHGFHGYRFIDREAFVGSYQAGVDCVLSGSADLAAVWAPSGSSTQPPPALAELAKGRAEELAVLGYTRDCPNDGVVLSPFAASADAALLERKLLALSESEDGRVLLKEVFAAERFQPAPVGSYRELDTMVFGTPGRS
jgi:phosphonate transport system substrate-binding protein